MIKKKLLKVTMKSFAVFLTSMSVVSASTLPSIYTDKSFHLVKIGNIAPVKYDLNGDKKVESISFNQKTDRLYIDKASIMLNTDCGIKGYAIVDLNKNDVYKQIVVFQARSNDLDYADIYSYKTNKIKLVGMINVTDWKLYINNNSILSGVGRTQFFQTDTARCYYKYNQGDTFSEIFLPYYPLMNATITAKIPVNVYKNKAISKSELIIINKGEKLKVLGTDRKNWVQLQTSKGMKVWLEINSNNEVTQYNKYTQEVFDGVFQAG